MRTEMDATLVPVAPAERPQAPEKPAGAEGSFASQLGEALQGVDKMQVDADKQAQLVAHGAGNLHEMSIALEKADIAMRLAMRVRNKLVDAYNDIMRMSI